MALRFDGQVAVVTGAGGGLGRAYALEYARLGAKVVVNDLGGSSRGDGSSKRAADAVVSEIVSAGGQAVADYNSVTEGAKIIKTAIDTYGRIDILVNNAGILRDVTFAKMTASDWQLLTDVHLNGAFECTHAAWPHFIKQKFGRVIMVASAAGLYGNFGQAHYSSVKMALVGFANSLSQEGKKYNINVNTIAPVAGSRMTEQVLPPDLVKALKPEYVSPLVMFLTHSSTTETGGIFEVGAGWISKLRWERTAGVSFPLSSLNVEAVRDAWSTVNDFTQSTNPTSSRDAFEAIMANINAATEEKKEEKQEQKPPSKQKKGKSDVDVALAKSYKFDKVSFTYTEKDVILYALAVGAALNPLDKKELKFTYENADDFSVLPSYGVIIPNSVLASFISVPGLSFDPMKLLHGEQYMELLRPLPTSGTLTSQARVSSIVDKKSGALVTLSVVTEDSEGVPVLKNEYSLFIRGIGGFEGGDAPAKEEQSFAPPKDVPPTVVHREKTNENQALLYRLTGDLNPLHADPEMAAMGSFPRPILHGLCSLGISVRTVLTHFADSDVKRFKSVRVRFVKHVFPGETLIVEMWRVSTTQIIFRVKVAERGEYVLGNACVTLHPKAGETVAPAAPAPVSAPSGFEAEKVFASLRPLFTPDLVSKVNAIFRFDVSGAGNKTQNWLLNLKKGGAGSIELVAADTKAECTVIIKDEDLAKLFNGQLNAQKAFMEGKISVKGNMMLAQKLQHLQVKPKL